MAPKLRRDLLNSGIADTAIAGVGHNNPPEPIEPPQLGFTIPEFCRAHRIGITTFYELRKKGRAPRTMKGLGRKEIVTAEEAARWRKERTEATD